MTYVIGVRPEPEPDELDLEVATALEEYLAAAENLSAVAAPWLARVRGTLPPTS